MDPKSILKDAEVHMTKSMDHLRSELKGLRTGRASPALIEFVKVNVYGAPTDLRACAAVSVPEPMQLLVKPFDPSITQEIKKAIEAANLGLNPQVDGKQVRVSIPAMSSDRRKQMAAQAKKVGEDTKIAVRNVRRDANKHADALSKSTTVHFSEDQIKELKDKIQDLLKKSETAIDEAVAAKTKEIMDV